MAERSKAWTVYDRSNIGIAVSNPASGMDVRPRVSVLCCPVSVEALRRANTPSKDSYQNVSMCRSRSPEAEAKGPRRTASAFKKNMLD
jgi:hypothetical protein